MTSKEELNKLIDELKHKNAKNRLEASKKLEELGEEAIEPLVTLLHDESDAIRRIAAFTLGKIQSERSIDPLVEALGDVSIDVRKTSAQALNRIGAPAVKSLVRALSHYEKNVRASAVMAIEKIGAVAIDDLIKTFYSDVKDARASAVWALEKIGPACIPKVLELIYSDIKDVRECSYWTLSRLGKPALEELAKFWNLEIVEGDKEPENNTQINIEKLLSEGNEKIKQWIKYMAELKKPSQSNSPTENSPTQ